MDALLKYLIRFYPISEQEQIAVKEISTVSSVKKNEILQPFGHTCKTIYFIKSGIARIFYLKEGKDITEHFAFENDIIARVESLFTGKPSQKAIQILEDAEIIAINASKLFMLYDEYPRIERLFRLIFEDAHVNTIHHMESIQFHSAEERYLALLKETEIVQKIPLKYVASYLGITQVSLSRIRANIK